MTGAAISIPIQTHDGTRSPLARRPRVEGTTPFGTVMSSVRWSGTRGSLSSAPRPAAEEMFEAPADAAARRLKTLRGRDHLDALRRQVSENAVREVNVVSGEAIPSETSATPRAEQPIPPASSAPSPVRAELPRPQLPVSESRNPGAHETLADMRSNSQASSDRALAAEVRAAPPATTDAKPAATFLPAVARQQASEGTLAHQIGRTLVVPRGSELSVPRSEIPTIGLRVVHGSRIDRSEPGAGAGRAESAVARPTAELQPEGDAPTVRFDELIRSIRVRAGEKQSSARLQLQPPRLGFMQVDVRLEGNQLHVEVRTETADARRLVHDQALQLKAALESAGIDVQQLQVSLDPDVLHSRGARNAGWTQSSWRGADGLEPRRAAKARENGESVPDARIDPDEWAAGEFPDAAAAIAARRFRRVDLRA